MERYIKTFEEYDTKLHKALISSRAISKSKLVMSILTILSIIDDVLHMDIRNIKNTFKNRDGYKKAYALSSELSALIYIMKMSTGNRQDLFYDVRRYGFDVDMILRYLKDDDFISYVENDRRFKSELGKYDEVLSFLEDYREWENRNKRIIGY